MVLSPAWNAMFLEHGQLMLVANHAHEPRAFGPCHGVGYIVHRRIEMATVQLDP
jgi:hypothetical protein